MTIRRLLAGAALLCLNFAAAQAADPVRLYSWSDYFGSGSIEAFTKETGLPVVYDVFDSNDIVETKLMTGKTGYDVITPNLAPHFARQLTVGVWEELDRSKLPNVTNMDPSIMAQLEKVDPGAKHGVPWMWGTAGIIANTTKIKAIMPDAPLDSWAMLFDPAIVSRFKDCGVTMLDDGGQVLGAAMAYKGKDLNTATQADLDEAAALVASIRPYIRKFHSSEYISGLASGDYCLALGFSGDATVASFRAQESGVPQTIDYHLPKEGGLIYFDVLAIPKDADNKDGAYAFINFVMRPDIAAGAANYLGFATANAAAMESVDAVLRTNVNLYPTAEMVAKMVVPKVRTTKEQKVWTRAWQVATGQR